MWHILFVYSIHIDMNFIAYTRGSGLEQVLSSTSIQRRPIYDFQSIWLNKFPSIISTVDKHLRMDLVRNDNVFLFW